MIALAFLIITLVCAHVWPYSLAEKKNALAGKVTRGAIWRTLCWRSMWRLFLIVLVPAISILCLIGLNSGRPEEAGEVAGTVTIVWMLIGAPYALIRSYWISGYFKLPDTSEEPPPAEGKEPAIYIFQNDKKTGPFTKSQFKQMFEAGMVDAHAKYWHAGMDGWKDVIPNPEC